MESKQHFIFRDRQGNILFECDSTSRHGANCAYSRFRKRQALIPPEELAALAATPSYHDIFPASDFSDEDFYHDHQFDTLLSASGYHDPIQN